MNRFVIFLDVDGVLNGLEQFEIGINFNKESLDVLKKLIKMYNAEIILITSLQGTGELETRNKLIKIFKDNNIHITDFINPNFDGLLLEKNISFRTSGIIDYLKNNKDINYVILDDEFQNEYKLFNLNYYKTKTLIGLKEKDLDKIAFSNIISKRINYLKYQENIRIKTRKIKQLCLTIKSIDNAKIIL